jgi:hypothetical protein
MVPLNRFVSLTDLVIKNFEGGYYHPDMYFKTGIIKDKRYAASGETMFGIDRKHGIALAKYPEWKPFWDAIDKAGARTKWAWNYHGGDLGPQLRILAGKLMYPHFSTLANRYLSQSAINAISNDDRLVIHFSYASWNGEGWFQRFAKAINAAVVVPAATKESIFKSTLGARVNSNNSLIAQHGKKMMKLFTGLNAGTSASVQKKNFRDVFNPSSWLRSFNSY